MPAKQISVTTAAIFVLLLAACSSRESSVTLPSKPHVDLPRVQYADEDSGIIREAETTVSLSSGEWYLGMEQFTRDARRAFVDRVRERLKGPNQQLVYVQAGNADIFGDVVVLLDAIRRAERNNVGLLVMGPSDSIRRLAVNLPPQPDPQVLYQRDPFYLQISVDGSGNVRLNQEDMGTITTPEKLRTTLENLLKQRNSGGVNQKSIAIKAAKNTSYLHLARTVDLAKGSGATPIAIVLDDIAEK